MVCNFVRIFFSLLLAFFIYINKLAYVSAAFQMCLRLAASSLTICPSVQEGKDLSHPYTNTHVVISKSFQCTSYVEFVLERKFICLFKTS